MASLLRESNWTAFSKYCRAFDASPGALRNEAFSAFRPYDLPSQFTGTEFAGFAAAAFWKASIALPKSSSM